MIYHFDSVFSDLWFMISWVPALTPLPPLAAPDGGFGVTSTPGENPGGSGHAPARATTLPARLPSEENVPPGENDGTRLAMVRPRANSAVGASSAGKASPLSVKGLKRPEAGSSTSEFPVASAKCRGGGAGCTRGSPERDRAPQPPPPSSPEVWGFRAGSLDRAPAWRCCVGSLRFGGSRIRV